MTQKSIGTTEGGMSMAIIDPCYVPAPPQPPLGPGGIPTPFPCIARLSNAVHTVKKNKVLIRNKKPLVEGSYIPDSTGDEGGCSQGPLPGVKGLKSRKNLGKCEFKQHSEKVKFRGKGVICAGSDTTHNNGNMPGLFSVPSQTTVSAEA